MISSLKNSELARVFSVNKEWQSLASDVLNDNIKAYYTAL